ncbi:hypothetical protein LCGC14_2529710 [marine sediment metagenome]|uniref:Uncharacterized protein n=1 Tax=marine sediment metagenome TaxID=412755 RepID=A0A0F9DM25_9ZZZZ
MNKEKLLALSRLFLGAKEKEENAKLVRIHLENEIATLIETPEQGQKTVKLANGTKITVKRGLIFKADIERIWKIISEVNTRDKSRRDEILPAPITVKVEKKLDEKGYKWYEEKHPEIFRELSEVVIVTPKKTAVTVKVS